MDFDELMKKVAVKMNETRDMVMDLTDKAGKKAGELYGDAKIRLKIADIQRDVNGLYREVGKAAYAANRAGEDVSAVINEKCDEIQRLCAEMEDLSKNLTAMKEVDEDEEDAIIEVDVEENEAPADEQPEPEVEQPVENPEE